MFSETRRREREEKGVEKEKEERDGTNRGTTLKMKIKMSYVCVNLISYSIRDSRVLAVLDAFLTSSCLYNKSSCNS